MKGDLVELSVFPTALDAEAARAALQDAGLRALVEGQESGTSLGVASVVPIIRLMVREEDLARAREALARWKAGPPRPG